MKTQITDVELVKKFISIKHSAESRGIEFSMSLKRIRQLLGTKKCAISGVTLNRIDKHPNQLTFDRFDNDRGYTDDNVVVCSHKVNQLKGSLSIADITMLYMAIQKRKLINN